ncbi:hypothetical protein [Bogoriella caseilytica]|uniref:hypothetical protein n=1 Tax=Bogoriella caseilytica TaxID=56055 RepID=UPI000F486215|nr:hypothetical protein [Bogoriella caseilytica]
MEDLLWALEAGEVTQITMERPSADSEGSFPVEWEGPGRPAYSSYPYNSEGMPVTDSISDAPEAPDGFADADHRTRILEAASRAGVPVIERDIDTDHGGFRLNYAVIASLAACLLLVAGPQPRLATRWAWFWLGVIVPVAWLVFVVLEPTPWGRSEPSPPRSRRLTGGWALLLALALGAILTSNPWYRDLFPP